MHPANDRRVVEVRASRGILVADQIHARPFQGRELAFRRPFPQPHIGVETGSAVLACVTWVLEPNSDREEPGVMGRAMCPLGIWTCVRRSQGPLRAGGSAGEEQASEEQKERFHTISGCMKLLGRYQGR